MNINTVTYVMYFTKQLFFSIFLPDDACIWAGTCSTNQYWRELYFLYV